MTLVFFIETLFTFGIHLIYLKNKTTLVVLNFLLKIGIKKQST